MAVSPARLAWLFGNGTDPGRHGASPEGGGRVEYRGAAIGHPKVLPARLGGRRQGIRPSCRVRATASARLAAPSLPSTWVTCLLTVSSATTRSCAMHWSDLPAASSRSTSSSRPAGGLARPNGAAATPLQVGVGIASPRRPKPPAPRVRAPTAALAAEPADAEVCRGSVILVHAEDRVTSPAGVSSQASSSTWAVISPPASPVLMTVLGSNRSTAVSVSARGQCSTPRGTTKSSRGASTTLPSRI